jgi:hypothetical protein
LFIVSQFIISRPISTMLYRYVTLEDPIGHHASADLLPILMKLGSRATDPHTTPNVRLLFSGRYWNGMMFWKAIDPMQHMDSWPLVKWLIFDVALIMIVFGGWKPLGPIRCQAFDRWLVDDHLLVKREVFESQFFVVLCCCPYIVRKRTALTYVFLNGSGHRCNGGCHHAEYRGARESHDVSVRRSQAICGCPGKCPSPKRFLHLTNAWWLLANRRCAIRTKNWGIN